MIADNTKKQIDRWVAKYPEGQQQSAVMEALKLVQADNEGFLTPKIIEAVANYLDMPSIAVAEVATFYENYNHAPVGKYVIRFCHNISCMLNGADELISYTQKKLKIKSGKVSGDGRFSIKKVECLGACVGAPMCQIGEQYYENLTTHKIDEIVDNLK